MDLRASSVGPLPKRLKCINQWNTQPSNDEDNDEEQNALKSNYSDDDSFQFPPDDDIFDMLRGIPYTTSFATVTERYFHMYYKIDVQEPQDDMCICIHSNHVCMLSIARSHNIFQNGKEVKKVDFKISDKLDRSINKVSGKSKHGAQPLQTNSNICIVTCSDGQTYGVKCCVIGKLIEINENLLEKPELLKEAPHKGGYLAIILPNLKLLDKIKGTLLTEDEYNAAILLRSSRKSSLNTKSEIIT